MAKNHYPFCYQILVSYYDADEGRNLRHRCAGVGFADSYIDAVAQIEEQEGEDLECIEHIEFIGERDQKLINIDPAWIPDLIHNEHLFWGEDLSNPPVNWGLREAKYINTEVYASEYFHKEAEKNDL